MVAAASRKAVAKRRSTSDVRANPTSVKWNKKMSNNCASALLVYTLLQMFLFLSFIETKGMSIAPYFGLIVLVAVIIPFCRNFEKRWEAMAASNLTDQSLAALFRRDQVVLWSLTFGLPIVFMGIIKLIASLF